MTSELIFPTPSSTGWPIWGHDHAVSGLQGAIRHGVRHAYILSGYHHVGKSALATAFSMSLTCPESSTSGIACGNCASCRRICRGTHPDVTVYDLVRQQQTSEKSTTSKNLSLNIQTVRDITASVSLRPMEADHRVVIVDDVETMQETAQEAFLKTLEEPPPYAVILLLTTDSDLLLETIRSRCTTIQLQTVPAATISAMLGASGIDAPLAQDIAAASVGRPGWAIQAANDPEMLEERLNLHASVVSWIRSDPYQRMVEATRLGDSFSKNREAVYTRLSAAQTIWRASVLQLLGVSGSERSGLGQREVQGVSPADAVAALHSIDTCFADLDANVRPRLALQSMVLQWPMLTN